MTPSNPQVSYLLLLGPCRCFVGAGVVKSVIAAVGIGLQDAAEAVKVTLGVRTGAVARRIVEGRRRRPAAKGPIVSDIGPDAPRHWRGSAPWCRRRAGDEPTEREPGSARTAVAGPSRRRHQPLNRQSERYG